MESFKEVKFSVQMKTAYMFDFLYYLSNHTQSFQNCV